MSGLQWFNDVYANIEYYEKGRCQGKKRLKKERAGSSEEKAIREVQGRCITLEQGESVLQQISFQSLMENQVQLQAYPNGKVILPRES